MQIYRNVHSSSGVTAVDGERYSGDAVFRMRNLKPQRAKPDRPGIAQIPQTAGMFRPLRGVNAHVNGQLAGRAHCQRTFEPSKLVAIATTPPTRCFQFR